MSLPRPDDDDPFYRAGAKPGPFFKGRELRGLVVFAVVMAIGWPVILSYARPRPAKEEPPPAVDPRPIEPDRGVAFEGLHDKEPMKLRDITAAKILLDRARATPPADLDREARRDVFFTQLWDRPDLYRGVPIRLEGTLKKTLVHAQANKEVAPEGRYTEVWFITRESQGHPYAALLVDPPPGLKPGFDQGERVVIDGYFLKLLGYQAGDVARAAPMLIGRMRWADADPRSGAPAVPAPGPWTKWAVPTTVVVVLMALYVAARVIFQARRVIPRPTGPASGSLLADRPVMDIAPGDLDRMLADVRDEDDAPAPRDDHEPGHAR